MIEHVLGRLAEVDDPLGQVGRPDPEGHVLGVAGTRGVVVAADAANPAGDRVCVSRVFPLHEHAVTAEDRRGAVALDDLPVGEIDFGVDAEAADDAGDRVPRHLDQLPWPFGCRLRGHLRHRLPLAGGPTSRQAVAVALVHPSRRGLAPFRLPIHRRAGKLAQAPDGFAIHRHGRRREVRTRRHLP